MKISIRQIAHDDGAHALWRAAANSAGLADDSTPADLRVADRAMSIIARVGQSPAAIALCTTDRANGEAHIVTISRESAATGQTDASPDAKPDAPPSLLSELLSKSVLKLLARRVHTCRVAAALGVDLTELWPAVRWRPGETPTPTPCDAMSDDHSPPGSPAPAAGE